MDLIIIDISILLISSIIVSVLFFHYCYWFSTPFFSHNSIKAFGVVDAVRALKKSCPVDFGNKWKLLSLNVGLPRCWSKETQLPGFQNSLYLYGASSVMNCSSMYAFSLIAEISKMGEWEPLPSTQALMLKAFREKELQQDDFMLADQVVGIHKGPNVQSCIALYRFMNFSDSTVKWVLYWNAQKLEFMFFLIQPAVSKTVESQCLITHIFTTSRPTQPATPLRVAQRLKNIAEFLQHSQLHVIASKYAAATPAVSRSCRVRYDGEPGNALPKPNVESPESKLVLVPVGRGFVVTAEKIKAVKKKPSLPMPVEDPSKITLIQRPDIMKRSMSEMTIKTIDQKVSPGKRSGSIDIKSSIIVEQEETVRIPKTTQTSFSESGIFSPSIEFQKTTSSGSENDDSYVSLRIIREQEKNEIFCSSTSDFELVDSNQQFQDFKIADFLTQGNYGASELQAEMVHASQFDRSLNLEYQSSGGWVYHSTLKNITVLTKTTAGQFLKILSYLCQMDLPVSSKDVWKCVKNPRFRFILDETVKTVKIVERISNSQKLIQVYHESSGFLRKECVDLCLLQTEREENQHSYTSFHSIEYEKCPLMTGVQRGNLRPSGWVVEKRGRKRCRVTHLMQVIVNNPDSLYIQELNTLVPLSAHNLRNYFMAKPN